MSESHGATNTVIWDGEYASPILPGQPVTLVIQDVLSDQEKHNKLRIVVKQSNTEIFHFVNATSFLVFAYEYLNDIGPEYPFFWESKGSPNLRTSGYTARTIKFNVRKNSTIYIEIATGTGTLEGDNVLMTEVLNRVDLIMPSSEFRALCFKVLNYSQAKLVASMIGQGNDKPKTGKRSGYPKRIPNQGN